MPDEDVAKPDDPRGGAESTQHLSAQPTAAEASSSIPKRIGHYHVKRMIGRGGMGTVYEAVQEHPRRTVAVKILRQGIASRSALRRFEFESQILARLRHPAIAQVYEAGTHDEGGGSAPYFVMEYIPNARPITEYARARTLDTRERLKLFATVCEAVHHGHQKGIIHRDLKPGNILVDTNGDPKIIDFGVARSTDSDLAVTTLQTGVGELVGTVQYMSPEQVEADPHDIDARSDIYSLGVVLYELLSGRLPYDVSKVPVLAAARIVKEEAPTRLSTVDSKLRGDLETIVREALEKERRRRYQSADELRQDILRYLRNEPIEARRDSGWYVLGKTLTRHKLAVAVICLFMAFLSAAAISLGLLYRIAERQRIEAERQTGIAQAVNDFLNDDLLAAVAPDMQGPEVTVRQAVDAASAGIEGKFADQPLVEASIRSTLAITYWHLGEYEAAEPHMRKALKLRRAELGDDDRQSIGEMNSLAVILRAQGKVTEAEALDRKTLAAARRVLGNEDPLTLSSINSLAVLLRRQDRLEEAEALHREALAGRRRLLGDDDPLTISSMTNLALVLRDLGQLDEAERLAHEAMRTAPRVLRAEHPLVLQTRHNFAAVLVSLERFEEAEPICRQNLAAARRVFGSGHPRVASALRMLAVALRGTGDDQEAEPLLAEALAIRREKLGDDDDSTLTVMTDLGACRTALGRFQEAKTILREGHRRSIAMHGHEHRLTREAAEALAELYTAWGPEGEAQRSPPSE